MENAFYGEMRVHFVDSKINFKYSLTVCGFNNIMQQVADEYCPIYFV